MKWQLYQGNIRPAPTGFMLPTAVTIGFLWAQNLTANYYISHSGSGDDIHCSDGADH
jgi:hypothetical protein